MKFIKTRESLNVWDYYADDTGTFQASIVHFEQPSHFGINGGRISKMFIQNYKTGEIVCNYDRGWDKIPTTEVKAFYDELLEKLN